MVQLLLLLTSPLACFIYTLIALYGWVNAYGVDLRRGPILALAFNLGLAIVHAIFGLVRHEPIDWHAITIGAPHVALLAIGVFYGLREVLKGRTI